MSVHGVRTKLWSLEEIFNTFVFLLSPITIAASGFWTKRKTVFLKEEFDIAW